jgi:hypothetical protein
MSKTALGLLIALLVAVVILISLYTLVRLFVCIGDTIMGRRRRDRHRRSRERSGRAGRG